MTRKLAVSYELTLEPENIPFRGNCSAVDLETDNATEGWIEDQLNAGNMYAWCWARVVAKVDGFEGDDSYGGISCRDRAEFERVFLPEMKRNALADLRANVVRAMTESVPEARKLERAARRTYRLLPKRVKG